MLQTLFLYFKSLLFPSLTILFQTEKKIRGCVERKQDKLARYRLNAGSGGGKAELSIGNVGEDKVEAYAERDMSWKVCEICTA